MNVDNFFRVQIFYYFVANKFQNLIKPWQRKQPKKQLSLLRKKQLRKQLRKSQLLKKVARRKQLRKRRSNFSFSYEKNPAVTRGAFLCYPPGMDQCPGTTMLFQYM